MCGICGIFDPGRRHAIETMVEAMRHRGPDDSGILQDDGIALGMTRLAIIDITAAGHQPMRNADGSVWIVYNGETYNFQSERELLQSKGYRFNSASDTEVVLHLYEEYGDDFLRRMRGMFALAIYDKRRGLGKARLLLARDHLGIKPLLYARVGPALVFASEMKAMLASEIVERTPDSEGLRLLLAYGSITQPMTAVSGVRMLLPGHRLVIEAGAERVERYWKLEPRRLSGLRTKPYQQLVQELRGTLEQSVRLQMVSDVPIGAFLSGGIDSSILVALMSRMSAHRVKTFSVGFSEEGSHIDETDEALRLAQFIGTDHTRVRVSGQDVRARINHIAGALDQPSVDGANSYLVSWAARQSVTVAISGTGGDELFAGYPWFINMARASYENDHPSPKLRAKTTLARLAGNGVVMSLTPTSLIRGLDRIRGWRGFLPAFAREHQVFGVAGAKRMLAPEMRNFASIDNLPEQDAASADELPDASPLQRVSALCLRGYTQNQLLRDIDAVSMAHSLEVRVPYLDPVLTDLALSLPDSTKLTPDTHALNPLTATYRQTGAKKILIDCARDLLPKNIDNQKKHGFGMPFDAWLKGPLRDVLEDTLSDGSVRRRGIFDVQQTRYERNRFLTGKSNWVFPWLLMMTELWCREVLDRPVQQHS